MQDLRAKIKIAVLIAVTVWISLAATYGILKPIANGCIMTYMYPTYVPISSPVGLSSEKYGVYLYHEGWKKIDFKEHLKKLNGVPVLFIPGNGGSYKQVRSLAAESDRAYQGGPLEQTFYQEASVAKVEGETGTNLDGFQLPNHYTRRLDWFAVDLEGEHSAMDGGILEEHAEYVVHAIHRILDQYKESFDARAKEGAANSASLPRSVILVGHSMGGFVARAAVVHPRLRKSAVETILTLSSPHQSPPLALQPSLGRYFTRVNQEWRKGYEVQISRSGYFASDPLLSHVVVVSISGGYHDYQVRSKLESLDGIVPSTHGFMISSTGVKNVWLSMEHQAILWCNQLVIQVSHTLLSLVDSGTGQPFSATRKRLTVLTRMLHSGIPQSFNWRTQSHTSQQIAHFPAKNVEDAPGSVVLSPDACPKSVHWSDDGLERDLYIQTSTVTVLAMDGRRRWLDLEKLGSNGKSHFIFVTNLLPCSGVRLHLWPEKGKSASLPVSKRVLEVTSKMVQIPSGPAPRQIEPGSQTEQAPPSAVLMLGPEDMRGFKFLTISVAPRPTVSGRPPPAVSMAVGQFFNPDAGRVKISPWSMLLSKYYNDDIFVKEDHSLVLNLSFPISLGLLPVTLQLETTGCGIKSSGFSDDQAGDIENNRLCRLRCFPPVALSWDDISGLHIFLNLQSETILVDSSPALLSSSAGSEKTTVLLLVDPHCSYKTNIVVSLSAAASRFLLLYNSQIVGFCIVVVFFALMRQAQAWNHDFPVPSMLTAVESNLRIPFPFFYLVIIPILLSLFLSLLTSQPLPPLAIFITVSVVCYSFANATVIIVILVSQLIFYMMAVVHVFIKTRWQVWEGNVCFVLFSWFGKLFSRFQSSKVIRVLGVNPLLATALSAITLACFIHPAMGLFLLLVFHAFCCHNALSSHVRSKKLQGGNGSQQSAFPLPNKLNLKESIEDNLSTSPGSSKSFGETQLEIFHHCHGLLILHLVAAVMFAPSLVAWLQRIGTNQSFPWLLDSFLCTGVILHGVCNSKPEFNSYLFSFFGLSRAEIRLDFIYLIAGNYTYICSLALAPYKVFYAMAAIGAISLALRILQKRTREKLEPHFGGRKHSHRH
ncbi:GPI inositol-deacylase isoform X1 [Benincasa hispida]|uniref:GPI inositol-deacylase isoform X1 n=2 Tax=Benincasa hispida TaxID=102211 RepID=UPI001902AD31|nr:GPI inositol-deacylase isoform X1 [Benincasa hispida]XP_038896441.1 GPI inositol-deacylase isoform X1 [Benincasa hispida]XP_038896442.1 GPI inositol-deacylase isoform X1 [Benincasa hispida]